MTMNDIKQQIQKQIDMHSGIWKETPVAVFTTHHEGYPPIITLATWRKDKDGMGDFIHDVREWAHIVPAWKVSRVSDGVIIAQSRTDQPGDMAAWYRQQQAKAGDV